MKTSVARIEALGTSYPLPDGIKLWHSLQSQTATPISAPADSADETVAIAVDQVAPATEPTASRSDRAQPSGEQFCQMDDF